MNATSYTVLRNGAALSQSLPSSALTYDDSAVAPGQTYSYVVRASNGGGTADSNAINISLPTTICQPPPEPFTLSASAVCNIAASPSAAVSLTWTSSANATTYGVFRDNTQIGSVAAAAFADNSSLVTGQTYSYFIRASGPGGTTDSNAVAVRIDPAVCSSPCSFACNASVAASAAETSPVVFSLRPQTSCEGVTAAVWTFGDGTGSPFLTATHLYASPGTYRWTVMAGNGTLATCQNSGTITITAMPAPSKRRAIRH
jgi:hypothetical protein